MNRKSVKQQHLPGMEPRPKSSAGRKPPPAEKPDIVLMHALDAHSPEELERALGLIKSLPETAEQATARLLIAGILAYKIARTAKQARLF